MIIKHLQEEENLFGTKFFALRRDLVVEFNLYDLQHDFYAF